jgi:steroid 5-alpha reductase family enzyme
MAAQTSPQPTSLTVLDWAGATVWVVGFFFEAVGDWQLTRFKANPNNKGKVLNTGLWRYTRHPNYFGEAVLWWGYFMIAVSAGGYWTVYSPILMTFLLLRVSGVTLLEKTLTKERTGYDSYIESTSAFIPLPPRKPRRS